ncbi:MAG: CbtA family protein [bacterium]
MFQRIIFAAAISGLIGGLVASAVQSIKVVPLIYEAETYEKKEAAPAPARPGKEVGRGQENEKTDFPALR